MPRIADEPITTPTQRLRLKVRAQAYCKTIEGCRSLGYIRKSGDRVAGYWIAIVEVGRTSKRHPIRRRERLGIADDYVAANGTNILSYKQAHDAASAWQAPLPSGSSGGPRIFTVRDAIEQHRSFGGKKGNKTERAKRAGYNNLRWNVLRENADGTPREGVAGLGDIAVNNVTTEQLTALRDSWIVESSEATALRNWTNLHSCLEQAHKKKANGISSPAAWQHVPAMSQDFEPRQLHFTNEQALAIIERARTIDAPVGDYFEALFRTGCRPGGELFSLTVSDFNPVKRRLTIRGRSEEVRSKTGTRQVTLDAFGFALLQRLTAGRPASAPLLTPCDDRGRIKAVMVKAVKAVMDGAAPGEDEIVPYAFRHTFISRRLEGDQAAGIPGMPTSLVATHCGTSEFMIRKTYAKFCDSVVDRWIEQTAPQPTLQVVKNDEPRQEPLPAAA